MRTPPSLLSCARSALWAAVSFAPMKIVQMKRMVNLVHMVNMVENVQMKQMVIMVHMRNIVHVVNIVHIVQMKQTVSMVHIDEHGTCGEHDTRGDYFTYCANEANGELGAYVEHNKIVQMCKLYL